MFLLPSFLGLLIFYVLPFGLIIHYAMVDNPLTMNFVGWQNFETLFRNSAFQQAMKNTVVFSCVVIPLGVVLPLLLAVVLE